MGFAALYDLGAGRLTTYDYFTWQVHVQALGATEIVFKIDNVKSTKWPVAESLKRFHNYIAPGPALAGLPSRIGKDGKGDIGSYRIPDLACGPPFRRLTSVLRAGRHRFTVTLRKSTHNAQKNSNEGVWRRFAERIGAYVIEDASVRPIKLYERVALYAGAEMNFGVTNGPMGLISLTPYPMTVLCNPRTTAKGWEGHGIKVGEQIPYALPSQRLVWREESDECLAGIAKELGI